MLVAPTSRSQLGLVCCVDCACGRGLTAAERARVSLREFRIEIKFALFCFFSTNNTLVRTAMPYVRTATQQLGRREHAPMQKEHSPLIAAVIDAANATRRSIAAEALFHDRHTRYIRALNSSPSLQAGRLRLSLARHSGGTASCGQGSYRPQSGCRCSTDRANASTNAR